MIKFGIWQTEQLDLAKLSGFFGRRKFIAATLYSDIAASCHPDRDVLLERILLRFATRTGTMKRTVSGRFKFFDELVLASIRRLAADGVRLMILDAGVSDGRTAVDLFDRLAAVPALDFELLATDYAPDVVAISDSRSRLVVVVDPPTNTPLQVIQPPFVFNMCQPESSWLYPLNTLVRTLVVATRVEKLLKRFAQGDPDCRISSIRLLHPRCSDLAESDHRFHFRRHDLLDPAPGEFHVVRAMNVLNRSYFCNADLRTIVANIFDSLKVGGILATGSNQDAGSQVDGAIYVRRQDGFERSEVSGLGSPIDEIVLQHKKV